MSPGCAERVTRPLSALTLDALSLQHATHTHAFGDRTQPVASPPLGQGALGDPTWAHQFVGFLATYRRPQKTPLPHFADRVPTLAPEPKRLLDTVRP